jgi:tyrosinase
VYWNWTLD